MDKKRRNRILLYVAAAVILLVVLGLIFGKKGDDAIKVTVEKASSRSIIETVSASGKIYPTTEVKISSDVSGEIVELLVEEGDSVVAGQLLAKVNPDIYQSAVERVVASVNSSKAQAANARANIENSRARKLSAEAEISRIQAQFRNAKIIHERNIQLLKEGVISSADFDQSLSNLEALEANVKSAQANLESSEAEINGAIQTAKAAEYLIKSNQATLSETRSNLNRTTIYAPNSGIVSSLSVEKGERVVGTAQMAGTEMMRIANLNAMEVQVDVSENDVLRVALNDSVEISVDAYIDRVFEGRVTHIANSATNASSGALTSDEVTNFIVKVNIEQDSYKDLITASKPYPFRPGMSASVDIKTDMKENVLCVPIQSVTTRIAEDDKENKDKKSDPMVVVFLSEADTVRHVQVKTGIQDDDYIQILEGLEDSVNVVSAPYSAISKDLKVGSKIEVVDEKDLYKEEK